MDLSQLNNNNSTLSLSNMNNSQLYSKCLVKNHQQYDVGLLCLRPGCIEKRMLCVKCVITHQFCGDYLVTIDDLKQKNQFEIESWPVMQRGRLLQGVIKETFDKKNADEMVEIDTIFENFAQVFLRELDIVKIDMKNQILQRGGSSKKIQDLKDAFRSSYSLDPLRQLVYGEMLHTQIGSASFATAIDRIINAQENSEAIADIQLRLKTFEDQQNVIHFDKTRFLEIQDQIIHDIQSLNRSIMASLRWRCMPSACPKVVKPLEIETGVYFRGCGKGGNNIFYSEDGWYEGFHYAKFDFDREIKDDFYVGIIPDQEKEVFKAFGDYPNHSLYSGSFKLMHITKGANFQKASAMGEFIVAALDIDQNQFFVEDESGSVRYDLDPNFQLKGKQWGLVFGFCGSNSTFSFRLIQTQ